MKILFAVLMSVSWANAQTQPGQLAFGPGQILTGNNLQEISFETMISQIPVGSVVTVGELHTYARHHQNQLRIAEGLASTGQKVHIGMEFLDYPAQSVIDAYLMGNLSEAKFLQQVGWGGDDFRFYRPLVLFPRQVSSQTFGLNMPRSITGKVGRSGLSSLTPEEMALLPPNFDLGNDLYKERFLDIISGHGSLPEEVKQNMFVAQSIWDDTMAWQTVVKKPSPDDFLVVIVGDFHVAYGGGLPDRLRQRGASSVVTVTQIPVKGMSQKEIRNLVDPTSRFGERSDFIWLTE